jgi:hypothetical protein
MSDATLDTPDQISVDRMAIEEIVIRPGERMLYVSLQYFDSNGEPVPVPANRPRTVRVENTEEFPAIFQQVMGAWVQAQPVKKLIDALKAANRISGITTS